MRIFIKRKLKIINSLLRFYILKQATPLVVNWEITQKCNQRCSYCNIWNNEVNELNTAEVCSVVDDLAAMGTQRVSLTGGEPLLREDLGEIVAYMRKNNIYVQINTNGILLHEKLSKISDIDMINFSLDGTERVHDSVRGQGTHKKTLAAIEAAARKQMNIMLTVTLAKHNLDLANIEYILTVARKYNSGVTFQPSTLNLLGAERKNTLACGKEQYRQLIDQLMSLKKAGNQQIFNSITGLRHLRCWPEATPIFCTAAKLTCRIQANGDINVCNRDPMVKQPVNCRNLGFRKAFQLLAPVVCDYCWCSRLVEFNYALAFNPEASLNLLKWELKK